MLTCLSLNRHISLLSTSFFMCPLLFSFWVLEHVTLGIKVDVSRSKNTSYSKWWQIFGLLLMMVSHSSLGLLFKMYLGMGQVRLFRG